MTATATAHDALAIDARARRGLRISVVEGCVYAIMVGASESYLGAMLQTAEFGVASYLALLMFGAQIAIPFFTPYMLRDLRLDYATYALLTAVPIVVKAPLFPEREPEPEPETR